MSAHASKGRRVGHSPSRHIRNMEQTVHSRDRSKSTCIVRVWNIHLTALPYHRQSKRENLPWKSQSGKTLRWTFLGLMPQGSSDVLSCHDSHKWTLHGKGHCTSWHRLLGDRQRGKGNGLHALSGFHGQPEAAGGPLCDGGGLV